MHWLIFQGHSRSSETLFYRQNTSFPINVQ